MYVEERTGMKMRLGQANNRKKEICRETVSCSFFPLLVVPPSLCDFGLYEENRTHSLS